MFQYLIHVEKGVMKYFSLQLQPVNTDISSRTRSPTILVDGKLNMPPRTAAKRRHEMMKTASRIHGGSENNLTPAFDGMFDTLAKRCKVDKMKDYVLSQKALTKKVASTAFKENSKTFESSPENAKRSIAVFYSSGVMGKRKYKSVRLALSMKKRETMGNGRSAITVMPNCPIPKLLPYNKLVKEINRVSIRNVYKLEEQFQGVMEDEITQGCFRKLIKYLPWLAKFYLRKDRKETLQWFGKTEGTFLFAVGGDGCPFGKNESACSFLLSFINVGKRVASSNDNFIIFGRNCEETSPVARKCCQFLCKEISDIEIKVFEIEGLHVTFKCAELPNDMKMLAMLGGELPNSARFFSTFADVSKDNCTDLKGTFSSHLCLSQGSTIWPPRTQTMWKPWKYEDRIKIANEVDKFKKSLFQKQLKEKQF